jgi:multiple sugar transport system permease protein
MNSKTLPYLLLAPATIFLVVFFLWPFLQIAWLAFTTEGGFTMQHFQTMAGNWKFWPTFWNTVILAAIVVPLQLVMALAMAQVVAKLKTTRNTILYIFTIPLGLSDLAAGIIWLAIFEQSGFLNSMLVGLGVVDKPILFLGYQNLWVIFIAVILAELWRATAIVMVILVSGMGLIPKEYYEAAEVFGAGPWKRFVKVTLPMLKPFHPDRDDPAHHRRVRSLRRGGGAGRHHPAGAGRRNLQLAVRAQRPQCRRRLRAGHPRHLHRRDAGVPACAAHPEGSHAMSGAVATADKPRAVSDIGAAGRFLFWAGVVLLCAWVLVPIYLLAVNTLSSPQEVTAFPKTGVPSFDMGSIQFFLSFEGVLKALWNSVLVAVLTMILSIAIGAPAGYALSRFEFPGKASFRMLVLMTRAFPLPLLALPIAVMFIRIGLDDTPDRAGAGAHHPRHPLRGADHLLDLFGHSARTRGGGLDARLQPAAGVPAGGAATGAAPASPPRPSSPSPSRGTRSSPPRC